MRSRSVHRDARDFCSGAQHTVCSFASQHEELAFAALTAKESIEESREQKSGEKLPLAISSDWYQRAMFMTGSIRLLCPVSLRIRSKSTTEVRSTGSRRQPKTRSSAQLIQLGPVPCKLSVLRESGTVCCPRRPCEREFSFPFSSQKCCQWLKPLPGPLRTWAA